MNQLSAEEFVTFSSDVGVAFYLRFPMDVCPSILPSIFQFHFGAFYCCPGSCVLHEMQKFEVNALMYSIRESEKRKLGRYDTFYKAKQNF